MDIKLLLNIFVLLMNQKKSQTEMKKFQEKKLRKLLKWAYKNSAYYRKTFEEKGINASNIALTPLKDFPVIDKNELIEHFDELVTNKNITQEKLSSLDKTSNCILNPVDAKIHFVHSSGSTGIPRYFYYDEKAWRMMLAGIIRGAFWGMSFLKILNFVRKGARLCYIAAVDGNYGGAVAIQNGITSMNASQLFIDLNTPVSLWLPRIKEFKPNLLMGYPSALKILAEVMETENLTDEKNDVQIVVTCGEPLSPSCRNYLEKSFKRTVINFYGTSESLALGLEHNPSDKMFLFDDLNYIEEINGVMYLTCLYNFSQPLIRYKITDRIQLLEKSSDKRIPFSRCSVVQSREEDVMWFFDGSRREFIHPLSIEGFCIQGLVDYQFVQTSENSFMVRIQVARYVDEKSCNTIQSKLKTALEKILVAKNLDFVSYGFSVVDKILLESNGKKKLIVRCA